MAFFIALDRCHATLLFIELIIYCVSLFGPNSGYVTVHDDINANQKILAIGTINPGVDPAKVFAILPNEVRDTADLYLSGKIDQWYSQIYDK